MLDLCNFLKINVYYVDTDSLHLDKDKIELVRTAYLYLVRTAYMYLQKYNQELIGKELGQFHPDFNISCGHSSNTVSQYCLMLGAKVYFDNLICELCATTGVPYRVKGVLAACVEAMCKKEDISIQEVYDRLCVQKPTFSLNKPQCVRFF